MKKYYTRACNFFYGSESKRLIKKKLSLPLCGDISISFNQVEIFIKENTLWKKKISLQKFAQHVIDHLYGEKSGN